MGIGSSSERSSLRSSCRSSLHCRSSSTARITAAGKVSRGVLWQGKVQPVEEKLGKAVASSLLLTRHRWATLRGDLPTLQSFADAWALLYSPKVHGISLETFYRQVMSAPGPSLLFIKESGGSSNVFGGFAPATWQREPLPYGDSSAFVFSFRQSDCEGGGIEC